MRDSNQADLRLLSDMGIPTPAAALISSGQQLPKSRPTLRSVGTAVIACLRLRRWQQSWAGHQKLHDSLVKKLEGMKRRGGRQEKERVSNAKEAH
jgi:hypothetical protein